MSKLAALLKDASTKFAKALADSKIDPARILSKSHQIESLTPEDRAIKLAKHQAVGKEDDAAKAARAKKPRSGRPVTLRLLTAAIKGGTVPSRGKTRLLKAVNAIREQKKLAATDLKSLF